MQGTDRNSTIEARKKGYNMVKPKVLRPDTVLKNYWSDNEQFADIFNAVLFNGKQMIRPEELENEDTEASYVLEHREYAESIRASRDNIKVSRKSTAFGVELVMLGLESQEHIHYAMPMRVMGYDYGIYRKQYDSNAKKYKKHNGLDEDEYLSRMKKTDRFMPVITIVVYYGEKPWDGALSLHGMLDISDEMKKFVNDYHMMLVEARKNNLIFHNVNNICLFNMLKIVLDRTMPKSETRKKVMAYASEHHVDKSVIMALAGATNCKIDYQMLSGKEEVDMCTLFEEIARESETKGKIEGKIEGKLEGKAEGIIETGFDCGLSEGDILEKLQNKLNVTLQMAQEYLNMFAGQKM